MKETAVLREWHGTTRAGKLEEYARYVEETGIREYLRTPGNRGALILTRTEGDVGHIITLSLWDSMKFIQAFAGSEVEQARYFARDADYLLEFEPTVRHYRAVVYRPREPLTSREQG